MIVDGFVTQKQEVFRECFAKVRTSRSYETSIQDKLQGKYVYTFIVRYFKGLDLSMLIEFDGKVIHINQINNVDHRDYVYEIVGIEKEMNVGEADIFE